MRQLLWLLLLLFSLFGLPFAFGQSTDFLNVQLFQASKEGNAARVRDLLEKGADVNARRADTMTPLIVAAHAGHPEIVRILLDRGADPDYESSFGNALFYAAGAGQVEIVKLLLQSGAKIDSKILMHSVETDTANPAVIQELIAKKPDLNEKDRTGFTPLMKATAHDKKEIINILLNAGADRSGCDELILTHSARKGDWNTIHDLIKKWIDINSEDVLGATALFYAVQRNHKELTELLISSGADVNHRSSKNGSTALMAVHGKNNSESLQVLLDNGAEVNFGNNESKTALMIASEYSNVPVMKLLLNNGANVNDADEYGDNVLVHCLRAPLHYQQDLLAAIKQLLSAGADVNQQNKFGRTAAQVAFYSQKLEILRLIAPKVQGKFWKGAEEDFRKAMDNAELLQMYLDAGADVNAGRELGWNFLIDAARRGSAQSVQLLIKAGADVNSSDSYGVTPIAIAVNRGEAEMVRVLISAGAKIEDVKNDLLGTALLSGHFDTAQVLLDAGAYVENQKELTLKGQIKQFTQKGNRSDAEETFRKLEKEFPDADRRAEIFQLGSLYLREGLYEESIDLHKEIIKLYPGSISVLSAYYQIAQAYRKLGFEFSMAKAYQDLLSYRVTDENSSLYDILNVKELAEQELTEYHRRTGN